MKKYLITSPEHYTQKAEIFAQRLEESFLRHKPDMALYRDKQNAAYESLAKVFLELCKKYNIEAFLHSDYLLASRLGADGVHLTSTQYDAIEKAKEKGLRVGISAHAHDEVLKAQKLEAFYASYSPIFASPDKDEPKGMEDLKNLLEICDINVIALGGIIEDSQIQALSKTKAYGFASIRYFYV